MPNVGGKKEVSPNNGDTKKEDRVATVHTHGAYDYTFDDWARWPDEPRDDPYMRDGNNEFSEADEENAERRGIPNYLASPNGEIQKYDPESKETTNVNYDEAPSDPYDPTRINNQDYKKFPDGEKTTSKKPIKPKKVKRKKMKDKTK